MSECTYCSEELEPTGGKLYVKQDGSRHYFCSSKCEKNWSRNRSHRYPEKNRVAAQ